MSSPAHPCRDAQAGGQPWSFAGVRVTRPMQRWSRWARRRRASSSPSSAELGGGACIPAAPLLYLPSSLLLHRNLSPGTSRICLSAEELSVHNDSLRLRNRPLERDMRLDRAANDMRKWENPENWSKTWTHCSAPVAKELTYWGQREGTALMSSTQSALV